MIYFISDIHGDVNFGGLREYFNIATEKDLLIILGDIGLAFGNTDENKKFTDYFLSANKNIAILDGNHENFEYLKSFPEEEWNGGKIRRLSEYIVLLQRGNIFRIEDKTFFTFGGCKSSPKWKEMGLWYFGEEPNADELNLAYNNLKKHNNSIDYILTHKYEQISPTRGVVCAGLQELTKYIEDNVKFKYWYAGHWHINGQLDEKHIFIYDQLTPIIL